MNRSLQFSVFFLLILFVLFYGFEYFNKHKDSKAIRLIDSIQTLQMLDSELNNNVRQVSENVYVNYDRLQKITTGITDLLSKMERQEWSDKYHLSLQKINENFQDKIEVVDLLKRENAILRNSIQFINHISREIFLMETGTEGVIGHVHQSLWNLNYVKQSGDMTFLDEVKQSISSLSKIKTNDKDLKKEVDIIILHVEMVVDKLPGYTERMRKVFSIPTASSLDTLYESLVADREANNARNFIYESISIVFIIILGVIVFLYNRRHVLYQESLLEAAKRDPQTGALNRYALSQDIAVASPPIVVLLFDIDKFHFINDAFGADEADSLLVSFHGALKNTFHRPVYRKGADEFIVLLENVSAQEAKKKVLQAYSEIIDASELSFTFTTLVYTCTGHMSLDNFEHDLQAGMYSAKLGRERVSIYDAADKNVSYYKNLSVNAHKERNKIVAALKEDRFFPFFQPIFDINAGKVTKYEALARLEEEGKILAPFKFILVAEQFNLIGEITRKILLKTFEKASLNQEVSFSINLSAHDMSDETLLDFIQTKATDFGIRPELITFEITETATMNDIDESIAFINKLREMGFLFAIDDFGVGQSSLQYIQELPADYIKIDGSFIKDIGKSESTREFVSLIHKVINLHGKKSIAEFVEDDVILDVLKEIGVDFAQGYHIGKPSEKLLSE